MYLVWLVGPIFDNFVDHYYGIIPFSSGFRIHNQSGPGGGSAACGPGVRGGSCDHGVRGCASCGLGDGCSRDQDHGRVLVSAHRMVHETRGVQPCGR